MEIEKVPTADTVNVNIDLAQITRAFDSMTSANQRFAETTRCIVEENGKTVRFIMGVAVSIVITVVGTALIAMTNK